MIMPESANETQLQPPEVPAIDGWRKMVDMEIDQLGWRTSTRIEKPDDDVTIYFIDVMPDTNMTFSPEGPATFSLSIFLDGLGTLSVNGAPPLRIQPGTAVLFACQRITRGENTISEGHRLHLVDIRFEAALLEKLGGVSLARLGGDVMIEHSLPEQDVFLIGFRAPPELLAVAASLERCRFEEGLARRLHLYSKAIEALSICLDTVGNLKGAKAVRPLNEEELEKLNAAVNAITHRYAFDWTVAKLAREVGLNERRLKEGFRLAIGKSVHNYLRNVRLDTAAVLLSSGLSVTETAYTVGFDNLSHFSKIFREHKGFLPSRYASQQR